MTVFHRLTFGVYIVGVTHAGRRDAFTGGWVMQTLFDPLLLALSINPQNASYPLLHAAGGFAVSVLKQGQLELARRFGTRSGWDQDKLSSVGWRPGRSGAPVLDEALAYLDCQLTERLRLGDHELSSAASSTGRYSTATPPRWPTPTRATWTAAAPSIRRSSELEAVLSRLQGRSHRQRIVRGRSLTSTWIPD
jgi:Flavin reductase like domain